MLPDFTLPIVIGGRRKQLVVRDVPAAVFFAGFPNAVPLADCWRAERPDAQQRVTVELARWTAGLLSRVVVLPRLTPELVKRFGSEGERATAAYLVAVGFRAPADEDTSQPGPAPAGVELPGGSTTLGWLVAPPPPNLRLALRLMGRKSGGVLPSALWQLPISEWCFNWRILLQDELLRRDDQGGGGGEEDRGPFTNDPTLLEAAG